MKRLDALESIAWAEYHFGGGHITGRAIPKKQMNRLVQLGFVYSKGMGTKCDADGGIGEKKKSQLKYLV